MRRLGIFVNISEVNRGYWGEKFLLDSKEKTKLVERLEKVGLDSFEGQNLPTSLFPENIPGNPVKDSGLTNPLRIRHTTPNSWEAEYHYPILDDRMGFDLYPKLKLDFEPEISVLTVYPSIGLFLSLNKQILARLYNFVNGECRRELVRLVRQVIPKENVVSLPYEQVLISEVVDDEFSYAPISATQRVINCTRSVARNTKKEDLIKLVDLKAFSEADSYPDIGRWHPRREEYLAIITNGIRREYERTQKDIIQRIVKEQEEARKRKARKRKMK